MIAIFIPPLVTRAADVAAAIRAASAATAAAGTPLLAVFMAATDAERAALAGDGSVPVYGDARGGGARARARRPLRRLAPRRMPDEPPALAGRRPRRRRRRARPLRSPPAAAGSRRRTSRRVLAAYGIPLVESRFAASAAEAGRRAAELGGPVALKAVAPGLVHKADAGGVALGAQRPGRRRRARRARWRSAVRECRTRTRGLPRPADGAGRHRADRRHRRRPGLRPGRRVRRRRRTPSSCSATWPSGSPRSARARPRGDAALAAHLPAARRLPRRARAADLAAVEDVLLRVSALAAAHPEIAELDCNPLTPARTAPSSSTPAFASPRRHPRGRSRRWIGSPPQRVAGKTRSARAEPLRR